MSEQAKIHSKDAFGHQFLKKFNINNSNSRKEFQTDTSGINETIGKNMIDIDDLSSQLRKNNDPNIVYESGNLINELQAEQINEKLHGIVHGSMNLQMAELSRQSNANSSNIEGNPEYHERS